MNLSIMFWRQYNPFCKSGFSGIKAALLVLTCAGMQRAAAQIELVPFIGTSHYSGDLGSGLSLKNMDFSELNFSSTRFAGGLGVRAYATRHWGFRGNLFFGSVAGTDQYTDDINRRNRNLSFFSPLVGVNAVLEYHFSLGSQMDRFYLLSGFDYFYFNPKAKYQGEVVELQPLGTEGQYYLQDKVPYNLYAPALVAGGGLKFFYTTSGYFSLEVTAHRTFTDYLDDVSTTYPDKNALLTSNGQTAVDLSDRNLGLVPGNTDPGAIRGNPGVKDNFFFISLCYSQRIGGSKKNSGVYRQPGGRARGLKRRCFEF